MNITDAVKADAPFRKWRKSQTLEQAIQRRLQWYRKHTPSEVSPLHEQRANEACHALQAWRDGTECEINTSLTSRAMIAKPIKHTLAQIFTHLPQPRPAQMTPLEMTLVELMNQTGKELRAAQHEAAATYEIAYRAQQNWYMLFNTLTVDRENYYKVFNKQSTHFKTYIRHVDREIARASYGSTRNAKNHDYHTYFAVIEEGSQTGRLHIHVLHFMQNLPKQALDPNKNLAVPTRRELACFKRLWSHGLSAPIIVRYSPDDAYGKIGYRWPYDVRIEAPLKVNSPLALAGYLSKYITKSYSSAKRSKLLWRVRKSHNLGNQLIQELLSTLTPNDLLRIASCPSNNVKLNNKLIPAANLRLQALKKYNCLHTINPSLKLTELAKQLQPQPSPLQCLRDSTQDAHTSNQQNSGNTPTMHTNETAASETWKRLYAQASLIRQKYFRTAPREYGTTTTRDYIYTTNNPATQTSNAQHPNNHTNKYAKRPQ